MTKSVVSAGPQVTVREVAELMRARNVGSVVIVEEERPVGFITDRDLAVSVIARGCDPSDPATVHASSPVVTTTPSTSLEAAAVLMVDHHIRRLAVVDGELLVGIVTLDDLATRTADRQLDPSVMSDITRAALPDFYVHLRGGT